MGGISATAVPVRTQMTQVGDQVITWDSHTNRDFSFLLRVRQELRGELIGPRGWARPLGEVLHGWCV